MKGEYRKPMNYNFNDLDKYLREGGDPEAIAKAFADSLNGAIAANSNTKKLNEKATKFCDAWREYVDVYFTTHKVPTGSVVSDFYLKPVELDKIMDALTEILPLIDIYNEIMGGTYSKLHNVNIPKFIDNKIKPNKPDSNSKITGYPRDTDDFNKAIGAFLKDIGL